MHPPNTALDNYIKKNEETHCVVTCNDFQDIMSSERVMQKKNVYNKRGEIDRYAFTCICITYLCKDTQKMFNIS